MSKLKQQLSIIQEKINEIGTEVEEIHEKFVNGRVLADERNNYVSPLSSLHIKARELDEMIINVSYDIMGDSPESDVWESSTAIYDRLKSEHKNIDDMAQYGASLSIWLTKTRFYLEMILFRLFRKHFDNQNLFREHFDNKNNFNPLDYYPFDYFEVIGEIRFPLRIVDIKGKLYYGEHPYKEWYPCKNLIKIQSSSYALWQEIHKITFFDDEMMLLSNPIYIEELGGNSDKTINYTRNYDKELDGKFTEKFIRCGTCNHGYLIDNTHKYREDLLKTYVSLCELCECGNVRLRSAA